MVAFKWEDLLPASKKLENRDGTPMGVAIEKWWIGEHGYLTLELFESLDVGLCAREQCSLVFYVGRQRLECFGASRVHQRPCPVVVDMPASNARPFECFPPPTNFFCQGGTLSRLGRCFPSVPDFNLLVVAVRARVDECLPCRATRWPTRPRRRRCPQASPILTPSHPQDLLQHSSTSDA